MNDKPSNSVRGGGAGALPRGERPRPTGFLQVDLENAYAQLGVSPFATTREIKQVVNQRIRELRSELRTRSGTEFSETEQAITDLQLIEEKIGSPKARARYDLDHPQNELLTVQPCPDDHFTDRSQRAGLVTAWLIEELGREALLPTAESLTFWMAASEDLDKLIAASPVTGAGRAAAEAGGAAPEPRPATGSRAADDATALPNVDQIGRILDEQSTGPKAAE